MDSERTTPFSTKELADAAGMKQITVRKLCQSGKLEGAYKVGRDWLIPPATAQAYISEKRARWEKY